MKKTIMGTSLLLMLAFSVSALNTSGEARNAGAAAGCSLENCDMSACGEGGCEGCCEGCC